MLRIRSLGASPVQDQDKSISQVSPGFRNSLDLRCLSIFDQVMKGATEPTGLLTMGLAGAAFRLGRLGMMARLTASPAKNFFNYGIGARLASGLFGFSLELPTLTVTGHLAGKVLGHEAASWGHDFASNLLVMGSLRMSGGMGSVLSRFVGPTSAWVPSLLTQTSMLGGTMLGLKAEQWFGLREFTTPTQLLTESLQILLQNQIAGHLTHRLFGPTFAAWEQRMDQKSEYLAQAWVRPIGDPLHHSVYAMAGGPGQLGLSVAELKKPATTELASKFSYPPEVEAAWLHLEDRWGQKDYYEGSREDLVRRRPDLEAMDLIWLHQAEDYGRRIPGAKVDILDAECLLGPSPQGSITTDKEILNQALRALGERNRVDGLAHRVIRIRIPKDIDNVSSKNSSGQDYYGYLELAADAELSLSNRVRFLTHSDQYVFIDIASLSLLETLGQTLFGKKNFQLHPVPGKISRDKVMSLRANRVSPVGFSRGRIFLEDANMEVHPFFFSGHDALTHALLDANILDPYPEITGWLYQRIQKRLPEGPFKKDLLDQLSDFNLGRGKTRIKNFAQHVLGNPLQSAVYSAQIAADPYTNSGKLKYLQELAEAYHSLVLEEFRTHAHLAGKEKFFLAPLNQTIRSIQLIRETMDQALALGIETPPPIYHGKILGTALRIDKKFKDPNYLKGTREELLANRVDLRDADALWFHQAKHYAQLFPGARYYNTGAEILTQKSTAKFVETDPTLLKQALSLLGKRERANSPARQVLLIEIPMDKIATEFLPDFPQLKFLSTYPLYSDLEQSLKERIHLVDVQGNKIIYRIPSLSLTEKLLQVAHGPDRVQFHFVPGILPRDVVMELKGKRVAPVALNFGPTYFGEIDRPVHPFILTDHDVFEHAAKDAEQARGVPEMASALYTEVKESFPASPSKEKVLNVLADLSLSPFEESPAAGLAQILLHPLNENIRAMKNNYDVQEIKEISQESRSFAEAYFSLLQERFASNPVLAEHSSTFLRPFEEIFKMLPVESLIPESEVSYFSAPITYPPEIEHIWQGIDSILRRPDYLQGSHEQLLAKRPPENWVDQLWLFQGEDYFRRFPKDQTRVQIGDIEELYLSGDRELSSKMDWDFLQQALGLLGDRNQYGSPARQILEIEMSNELINSTFMGSIIGSDKSFSLLGIFLDLDLIPVDKFPLKLFKEKTTLFRLPSLSLWERVLKVMWGDWSTQFQYVLGTLPRDSRRDIVMALRGQRTPPVGLSRDPIYLDDTRGVVHPFILPLHDAYFHNALSARGARGIPELYQRIYRLLQKRFPNDPQVEPVLNQLADMDDLAIPIQEIIPFLTLVDQGKLNPTDPTARWREIVELDRLGAALAPIVSKRWLNQKEELSAEEQTLLQDFLRWREAIQLERKKIFLASGS